MTLTVGFIGLGTMGLPMASHILNRGFAVKLYARRPEIFQGKAKALVEQGAIACFSLTEVAQNVDVVITNVTGTADVEAVLLGADGATRSAKPNTLFIDHSTIDPTRTADIARQLSRMGMMFVDVMQILYI